MCRISGSYGYSPTVVASMLEKQKRGGPDMAKFKKVDDVVFGHNLLAIIGNQPQPVESERYLMTFNGCIYNYKDLGNFSSDTIAALAHFQQHGLKALDDFNGMFAIGLYDKVDKKIHLIVDRMGQKPIYYYQSKGKFAFASSPASLFDLQDKWAVDQKQLQSYWLLGGTMGDHLFDGIKKVCGSEIHTYDIEKDKVDVTRYWSPRYVEEKDIEGLVVDAIDKVKVADVPIHIFLSGGIDSSLVASRFTGGQAIHLDSPEKQYAQRVSNRFGISLKVLSPSSFDADECLTDFVTETGEPCMAALIPYITSREVSKHGRVAITANGADELFFGYDRTHDDLTDGQMKHSYRSLDGGGMFPFYGKFNGKNNGRMWELGGYVQFDLNKTLDFASMCFGLEVRAPFLDHRLVEAALSIPESRHKKDGNKTILKGMLRKLGFDDAFLNRPKLGFSLHKQPDNLERMCQKAFLWAQTEGYLRVDTKKLSGRDLRYLEMSALSFFYWHKVWNFKIL